MSKIEIPLSPIHIINRIDDFVPYRHTKAYIVRRTIRTDSPFRIGKREKTTIQELQKACGYSSLNKFLSHKQKWDAVSGEIPLAYFRAIGVNRDILDFTVELDLEEFERAVELPLYPKIAVVRLMSFLRSELALPRGLNEQEAIAYLFEWMEENPLPCCINYPGLKSIFLTPDGTIRTVFHPPAIGYTRTHALPGKAGTSTGRSCFS